MPEYADLPNIGGTAHAYGIEPVDLYGISARLLPGMSEAGAGFPVAWIVPGNGSGYEPFPGAGMSDYVPAPRAGLAGCVPCSAGRGLSGFFSGNDPFWDLLVLPATILGGGYLGARKMGWL